MEVMINIFIINFIFLIFYIIEKYYVRRYSKIFFVSMLFTELLTYSTFFTHKEYRLLLLIFIFYNYISIDVISAIFKNLNSSPILDEDDDVGDV